MRGVSAVLTLHIAYLFNPRRKHQRTEAWGNWRIRGLSADRLSVWLVRGDISPEDSHSRPTRRTWRSPSDTEWDNAECEEEDQLGIDRQPLEWNLLSK